MKKKWGEVNTTAIPRHGQGEKQWTSTAHMMGRETYRILHKAKGAYDRARGQGDTSLGAPLDLSFTRFEEPVRFVEKVASGKHTAILRWTAYDPPSYLIATKEERILSGQRGESRVTRLVAKAKHGPRLFESLGQAAGIAARYEAFLEENNRTPPSRATSPGGPRPHPLPPTVK